jgi:hypothetical protein
VKKLLAIGITLAMVLGLTAGSFAFDTERVAVPASKLQTMEQSLGGLHPKDECWIWMDQLAGWIWVHSAGYFDSCLEFKKFVDPYAGYTDCYPPYFPFNVESMKIIMHAYWGDPYLYYDIVFTVDIEEPGEIDPYSGCIGPGPKIWESDPLAISLPGGWLGWVNITFPSVWVYEPFFVSWHILEATPNVSGWSNDFDGPTPCWNWVELSAAGYPGWYEFAYIGWSGDLLFGVDGRPYHNVAVDMGSFEAVPGDGFVTLNWQSLSETNNQSWTVKRDNVEIWTTPGQGNKETPTDYRYVDRDVVEGATYSYTIEAVNLEGNVDAYGPVTATVSTVPHEFLLAQNYPNPFNASTVIRYELAADEHVTLRVFNISGQEVASLVNTDQKAGRYTVQWTGKDVSSGVYFYTLTAGDFSQTKKMVFVK